MVKKVIKTNPNLIELINKLYEQSRNEDAAIWRDVAQRLERSNRRTAEVNLSELTCQSIIREAHNSLRHFWIAREMQWQIGW